MPGGSGKKGRKQGKKKCPKAPTPTDDNRVAFEQSVLHRSTTSTCTTNILTPSSSTCSTSQADKNGCQKDQTSLSLDVYSSPPQQCLNVVSAISSSTQTQTKVPTLPPPLIPIQKTPQITRHPIFPAPASPFSLIFLHGNIRTCAGCHRPFPKKLDNTFADPPFDLAVRHEEERSFTHPETKERLKKFGNAYYHAYLACITANWPAFESSQLNIALDVRRRMLQVHKDLILANFNIDI